jgi:hypothetical protein
LENWELENWELENWELDIKELWAYSMKINPFWNGLQNIYRFGGVQGV